MFECLGTRLLLSLPICMGVSGDISEPKRPYSYLHHGLKEPIPTATSLPGLMHVEVQYTQWLHLVLDARWILQMGERDRMKDV